MSVSRTRRLTAVVELSNRQTRTRIRTNNAHTPRVACPCGVHRPRKANGEPACDVCNPRS